MTLLKMSIYGAVIILAVLIIRAFTLHKLPKKTFLVLWGVALLRLLVPFEINSGLSLYSLVPETWNIEQLLSKADAKQSDDSAGTNTAGTATQGNLQNPAFNNSTAQNDSANNTINNNSAQNSGTQQTNHAVNTASNASTQDTPGNSTIPNNITTENNPQNPDNNSTTNNNTATANTESKVAIPNTHLTPKLQPAFTELLRTHWLLILWSVGALCCSVFFLISYIVCLLEFRTALPITNDHAREFLRYHWTNRTIHLRQSDRIAAPLTYGLFHPVILLPKKMDWDNHAQLDYVLYHEFTHIRRFDLLTKLLVTAALCLHWFNPLVWVMYYLFNRDIELSCDECVVDYFETTGSKADYARALINMEEKKSRLTPLCNNFSKQAIEERITAIMKSKPVTTGMITVAILIVATVVVTLATSSKEASASPDDSSPFMVFRESDFASGAFDEKDEAALAKTLWGRFLEFCELYNSSINASKNAPGYTTEDFVPITMDARWPEGYIATSYYLPVADKHLTSLEDFWAYLGTVCSENYIKTLEYAVFYTAEDSLLSREPVLAEQNGTLYTKPFDNEAPLPDFTKPVTWLDNRSNPYFYLLSDNRVVLLYKNPIADNTIEVFFTQQKGGWYVDDLSFDNFPGHFIPDSINHTLHRFRVPLAELHSEELIDTGEPNDVLLEANRLRITQELFSAYQKMQEEFFYTNLKCASLITSQDWVTINGQSGYTKVLDERFPTLQSVIDYMETICTSECAEEIRNKNWHMDTDHPDLAELNGELYTQCYDLAGYKPTYRFTDITYPQTDTIAIKYEGYVDTRINVMETGTMTIRYQNGVWRIASHDYEYRNPYFDIYNDEKLLRISCTEEGYDSPAICNDIIFYRAEEGETLEDVLVAMKTAILEPLTIPSKDRSFTVTSFDVTTPQECEYIDYSNLRLPVLTGYYAFEGTDLVTIEERLQEGITDAGGRVPFLAQGSEGMFHFILLEEEGVYRLQREESAENMLDGIWSFDTNATPDSTDIPACYQAVQSLISPTYVGTTVHRLVEPTEAFSAIHGAQSVAQPTAQNGHTFTIQYLHYKKGASLHNITLNLSPYAADRTWVEKGMFYDEESNCIYAVFVRTYEETTEPAKEGPGLLLACIPAGQPENYTIVPLGNNAEPALPPAWTYSALLLGDTIYLNSHSSSGTFWAIDLTTKELNSLQVVNDTIRTAASSYLASCGLGTEHDATFFLMGSMDDYVVYSAYIAYSHDNAPTYFTIYHTYQNGKLAGKVIERHPIPIYDRNTGTAANAFYLSMEDVANIGKERFDEYYRTKSYTGPYEITSIHMTDAYTISVDFQITEVEAFDIYTEGTFEITYDFEKKDWQISSYHETTPDYLSSMASYPTMPSSDVVVLEKNWNLTVLNEIELPRFQTLARAGGNITPEASDSINIGQFFTIALDGIQYFFLGEDAPENNARAWNIAITTPDYPLSGGAKVGMTAAELLAQHPALAKTELTQYDPVFTAKYSSHFAFRDDQFPESFLAEYDYAYTAYLDKGREGLPVCIAFLIKDNTVAAITVYMPTAN